MLLVLFQPACTDPAPLPSPPPFPARVISLAPSITEILFDLGLGERLVGVTRYCDYPPEALDKPKVGGYYDINYEALLSLKPDLAILLVEHTDAAARLNELGIRTMPVNHSRVQGILNSLSAIGEAFGPKVGSRASERKQDLEARVKAIRSAVQNRSGIPGPEFRSTGISENPPRVMVAVGRLMDRGSGGEIYISGRDGFYDDLINLAGGVNAYDDETLKFPAISAEGLVRLDPDIIIEMVPDLKGEADHRELMALWQEKPGVRAVREGRVHILGADYVVVPGPRFVDLLEDMVRVIWEIDASGPLGEKRSFADGR